MSDAEEEFEDAQSEDESPVMNGDGDVNGDVDGDAEVSSDNAATATATATAKRLKRKPKPEYPMRVSDRENKGMASSTFLADWLSTHYEPKDETEGEICSKVYDLYFNECVRRQDAALDYHEFLAAALKVFPTIAKESRVPEGKKTKKQMFAGLVMRPESPLYTLSKRKKKAPEDGVKEKKTGFNLKEFESRVVDAVKELKKVGGVGVGRLKRYFSENFPDYHVELKPHLIINALDRLAAYGKIEHEKGVGACAYYSPLKSEEEKKEESDKEEEEKNEDEEKDKDDESLKSPESEEKGEDDETEKKKDEEGEKDFEVEKVLNRKKSKGQWLYLVRWAGFEESEDTWEPLENLEGSEEIMEECTKDILKAEKADKLARKKAWKQRQKTTASKWEPSKRSTIDHLKFVLTACTDPYTASVSSIKKYVATNYAADFDLANKIGRFKQTLEKLSDAGKLHYLSGKGLSGNLALTEDGLSALTKSSANTVDNMVLEAVIAMAEPKGAAMLKIKKYFAQFLPSLKTAERSKSFKKSIEAAVKKGILYQVSGLGMTGSYQLMEAYAPPPATIRRILKNEVWHDDEYSDMEIKDESDKEVDVDEDEPVYKPRGSTTSGRKVTVTERKQAPIVAPRAKVATGSKVATGAKRKAAATSKGKFAEESEEEEEEEEEEKESSAESEEEEEPPKKRGKQTPAKRGKAVAASTPAKKGKKAPVKTAAASPRGGKGGRGAGGGARGAARGAAKKSVAPPSSEEEEEDSDKESIASDFEDHPPPIQSVKKGRGAARGAARGKASPRGKPAPKSPVKPPVNKAAKKAVPVSVGRGGGRAARAKPTFYGTPSPEYDDSDVSADEAPKPKKSPAKRTPAMKGRDSAASSPAKRGRGAAKSPAKPPPPPSPSDSEPASDSDSDPPAPPPKAKGRGRGATAPAAAPAARSPAKKTPANKTPAKQTPVKQTPAKQTPAKKTPAKGRGAGKRRRRDDSDSD